MMKYFKEFHQSRGERRMARLDYSSTRHLSDHMLKDIGLSRDDVSRMAYRVG
ncbi:DUF1127 domain-containing protein [Ostreiculturibacter nitratireducens]|uniref:DUF1127 domain-containing protein n=1 Tax=Ostreiculturibacter nitratireducens TaxID=3075226 RepID=UPI0031B56490